MACINLRVPTLTTLSWANARLKKADEAVAAAPDATTSWRRLIMVNLGVALRPVEFARNVPRWHASNAPGRTGLARFRCGSDIEGQTAAVGKLRTSCLPRIRPFTLSHALPRRER